MSAEYADCAHGSDDRFSCFGCEFGEDIGPKTLAQMNPKRWTVRFEAPFVDQVRLLSGDRRWPLRPAPTGAGGETP